jgi:hypothetical protein
MYNQNYRLAESSRRLTYALKAWIKESVGKYSVTNTANVSFLKLALFKAVYAAGQDLLKVGAAHSRRALRRAQGLDL